MMQAIYVVCLLLATVAIYLATKIQDEVFKVGMFVTALVLGFVTLICAPWALKVLVILPLLLGNLNSFSY